VDDEVHQMVTKNIELPEIIVEGEGKVGKDPDRFLVGVLDELLHPFPRKNLDLDIGILKDIELVIELKWNIEGIRIRDQCHPSNQSQGNEVLQ
jgi:hypothetical protein